MSGQAGSIARSNLIHHVLVRRAAAQGSLLLAACCATLFFFGWVRVWVASLLDLGQLRVILDQFRDFERFAPVPFDAVLTHTGRVGMTFDEPIVILCTVVWCVARGSDIVSGELSRGTMEMMLSQAISRSTWMVSHALVSIAGLALIVCSLWAGVAVGIETTTLRETVPTPTMRIPFTLIEIPLSDAEPVKEEFPLSSVVQWQVFTTGAFALFALGFFLLGLTTMLSSMDRYRWRTIGAVMSIYVIQLVMFGLGKATEQLVWLRGMSFFNGYRPQKQIALVANEGVWAPWSFANPDAESWFGPMFYPTMLLVGGLIGYALAIVIFNRRDLPAPL